MKKLLALAGCLMLLVSMSACSSSDDGGDGGGSFTAPFNFAGTWTAVSTMTDNDENWNNDHAEGTTYTHTLVITQSGSNLSLVDQDGHYDSLTFSGTGDATTGAFSVSFTSGCVVITYTGQALGDNSMSVNLQGDECAASGFPSGKHVTATGTATR